MRENVGVANRWRIKVRKIVHRAANHNVARPAARVSLLAALVLVGLTGCDNQQSEAEATGPAGATPEAAADSPVRDCQVTVNARPWAVFRDLADRMAAGQPAPQSDLEAYANLPAVTAWRNSRAPYVPTPGRIAAWLEDAWWEEQGRPGRKKINSESRSMGRGFRYCQSHGRQITDLVKEFSDTTSTCRIRELADTWLGPERSPRPLVLNLMPAKPEIRTFEGEIFVDTGVLMAGGAEQTARQVVALMYRDLAAVRGANPVDSEGEQVIAECFRVMMNDGVAGWIEKSLQTFFGQGHPTLAEVNIIPEDSFRGAQNAVGRMSTWLPDILADPANMTERGHTFARYLVASGGFTNLGIAMAEVIVGRLGEDRLRQVRRSVPDFLAAYQEAARLNPEPVPDPGTVGISLYESVMPLPEDLYGQLHELLSRYFDGS